MYHEAGKKGANQVAPPRFAIGGARATLDPRNAKVEDLLPLAKHKLELPTGWEKVHQYIYVLQPTTDEHGWQYRSVWSDGPLKDGDELWTRTNAPNLDVRRRLWMTTVVKRNELSTGKSKLSVALSTKKRGDIMEGELYRQESGALMKSWTKRYVVLTDTALTVYTDAKEKGGKKLSELPLTGCEAKMLFGVQCPGREFAFSIRHTNGNLLGLFDADNREVRRRWVVAIRYQLALLSPDVNFPPFDYGPPTGEEATTRVLMCGELQKQGHVIRNWKNRFFQLTPNELQYYDRESLKGSIQTIGASLITDEKSLDFTLRSSDNKLLTMRADTLNNKSTWVRAISRQIILQNEKKARYEEDAAMMMQATLTNASDAKVTKEEPKAAESTETVTAAATVATAAEAEEAAPTEEAAKEAAPVPAPVDSETTPVDSSDIELKEEEEPAVEVVAPIETPVETVIMTTEEAADAMAGGEAVDSDDDDEPAAGESGEAVESTEAEKAEEPEKEDVLTVAGVALEEPKDANDTEEKPVEASTDKAELDESTDEADQAMASVMARKSDEEIIRRMSLTALEGSAGIKTNAEKATPSTPPAASEAPSTPGGSEGPDYSAMIDRSGEKPIKFTTLKPVGSTQRRESVGQRRESVGGASFAARRASFNGNNGNSDPTPAGKVVIHGGYQKVGALFNTEFVKCIEVM
jgi:hypothetical protein